MFTGIVQNLGTLVAKKTTNYGMVFEIRSDLPSSFFKKGASIMVDGVCLTVESYSRFKKIFYVSLVTETLERSRFLQVKVGDKLNLEPPVSLNTLLSGHLVTGHSDAVASVLKVEPLQVAIPKKMMRFMAEKGSVTLNGVSLTIAKKLKNGIEIALIPETKKSTNLGLLKKGDNLNVEVDLIARYLDSLLSR